ncbi:hypothetical protein NQZ79_g7601 [Umbelopsis isabellina]|nr:hypothetical protein NQZ79_g7601 [Umbelopsis isabellina]
MNSDPIQIRTASSDRLRELIDNASTLVSGQLSSHGKDDKSLTEQLRERIDKLEIAGETSENDPKEPLDTSKDNTRWTFVSECLKYLHSIQRVLNAKEDTEEANDHRELLGIKDLRVVHTLLEIVVTWGLYPQLLQGVGLPLSQRIKSGYSNKAFLGSTANEHFTNKTLKMEYLSHIMLSLTEIIQSKPSKETYTSVASILINRHLIDVYAGLLQLGYAPYSAIEKEQNELSNTNEKIQEIDESTDDLQLGPVNTTATHIKREKFAENFKHLFQSVDTHKSMESLSLLLGTSPLHPVPTWLRSVCGRFLSQVLLRPNGVSAVLDYTLGGVQEAQMEKLSKLIITLPFQVRSVESYLSVICPQLVEIVNRGVPGAKYQLGILRAKKNEVTQEDSDESSFDRTLLSEEEIQRMLTAVHGLLVTGEPSPELIQAFLSSSIPALYHLYQFSIQAKSSYRETTLAILSTYFRITSVSEATVTLRKILFDKMADKRLAYYAPGPSGGVAMRLHKKLPVVAGDHLHVDTGIFVELVQTIGLPNLCGDFFVSLLNEYFSLQSASARSAEPKVILMVLNLIMTMLDALGPTILQNPTQIIAFASNVIDSHLMQENDRGKQSTTTDKVNTGMGGIANLVPSDDEAHIGDEEDEASTMEDDLSTLFLAINLLGAVLNENENLDKKARHLLSALLPKMQTLQSHPIATIQDSARELSLVIKSIEAEEDITRRAAGSSSITQSSVEKYKHAMEALRDDLMPVRAHGMGMLKEMILAKDPLVAQGKGLDEVLDIFVTMVQDDDSKLAQIYTDTKRPMDHRLRVGEALQQTVQRCGDALAKYVDTLLEPLEIVLDSRQTDKHLRVSALSIIGVACQTCPVALMDKLWYLMNWILTILEVEKAVEIRRAATVVILSVFRGFANQTLYSYPADLLKRTYRTLKYVEETDHDDLTRYQARVALSDLDAIMRNEIFH